jgi:large-conductance mechanosensitive channel
MSQEFNATHTVFMGMAAALLVSAVITSRTYGISSFIIVGFVIYCMSVAVNGLRQGEIEAAEAELEEEEKYYREQPRQKQRD